MAAPAALAAAEGPERDCFPLTDLDREALARFDLDAEEAPLEQLPEDEELRIGEIRVARQPIFDTDDPEEDNFLFRTVNFLNIQTREGAIRSALLFEEAETVAREVLAESERTLRDKPYLYDARVIPRRLCNGRLDVDVVVRDVWTLNPRLDFTRAGGENRLSLGLSDPNVLGTGKSVIVTFDRDQDRTGRSLLYDDPNLFGSRVTLGLRGADTDDGARAGFSLQHPFYSLDTRFAAGVDAERRRTQEGLFFRGDRIAEFGVDRRSARLFGGFSEGVEDHVTTRWLAGIDYTEHRFSELRGVPQPEQFPQDRRRIYPWLGFERIDARYERVVNLDRIERTEDVFVGNRFSGRFGYADSAWGATDARLVYAAEADGGLRMGGGEAEGTNPTGRHLVRYDAELEGELALPEARFEQVTLTGSFEYRFNHTERFSFLAGGRATITRNLTEDRQLLLGGRDGLRGYPNRYQEGDRSFVITLEERYFSDLFIFRLFRVGAAAFIDFGRAWSPGDALDGPSGVLANLGIGLRLESTRTRRDRVMHLDIALPLRDGPNVRGLEITLRGRPSF